MLDRYDFVGQASFLADIPLGQDPVHGFYDSTFAGFIRKAPVVAMFHIGSIYIPQFTLENHLILEDTLQAQQEGQLDEYFIAHPEAPGICNYRIKGLKIAQNDLHLTTAELTIPVTYSATSPDLKRDLRTVLNPAYSSIRRDKISLVHHERGREPLPDNHPSTSLLFDRINRLTMSGGDLYQEQGTDMLIYSLFLFYCSRLVSRSKRLAPNPNC